MTIRRMPIRQMQIRWILNHQMTISEGWFANADMRNVESPNAHSLNADSHYAPSPKTDSHYADSLKANSPNADSPNSDSPNVNLPNKEYKMNIIPYALFNNE